MKDLQKFKKDIQNLLVERYNAIPIFGEEVKNIVNKNLKSFPAERFFDYYIFNIKYMKYIIGFDNAYNMIIFYSDGVCVEGFYQCSSCNMKFIEIEKIDLFEKRQKEMNKFVEWFREKYKELNNGSKSSINEGWYSWC